MTLEFNFRTSEIFLNNLSLCKAPTNPRLCYSGKRAHQWLQRQVAQLQQGHPHTRHGGRRPTFL